MTTLLLAVGCLPPQNHPFVAETAESPRFSFTDVAVEAGVQDPGGRNRGAAAADFDGDGDLDLYASNPGDDARLWLNRGDGTFDEQPGAPDVDWNEGVAAADYDNDGDPDLYLACGGFGTTCAGGLFRNDGVRDGRVVFTDVTAETGIAPVEVASFGPMWGDVDGDGRLDLFVPTKDLLDGDLCLCASGSDTDETYGDPGMPASPPADDASTADLLLHAREDGTFEEIAAAAGVADPADNHPSCFLDFDEDGRLDLYTVGRKAPNHLYQNDGGRFHVTGDEALQAPWNAFAALADDFNNDGHMDILVSAYHQPDHDFERQGLYLGDGEGGWIDAAADTELTVLTDNDDYFGAMGLQAYDIDGDGWLEVLFGNGNPTAGGGERNRLYSIVPDETRTGGIRFVDVTDTMDSPAPVDPDWAGDVAPYPYRTHGITMGDLDGDGDVDVFEGNGGFYTDQREPNRLWRNDGAAENAWIRVDLAGTDDNRDGIGARVRVSGDDDAWQVVRLAKTASGFNSTLPSTMQVGVGRHAPPYTVTVTWPSGGEDVVTDVDAGETVVVEQTP